MRDSWVKRLLFRKSNKPTWLQMIGGSLYKVSDLHTSDSISNIKTIIDTMRALVRDSQISTALSYYATDATIPNTSGQIIWATGKTPQDKDVADIINELFDRWSINTYVRDHILELATIGNLYIPTTYMYKDYIGHSKHMVALDNNTIPEDDYDIIPSTKILPENITHLYFQGKPQGFLYQEDDRTSDITSLPEYACIHFSLGGLLGEYTIDTTDSNGDGKTYDIKFAKPLMADAIQPTQTLSLLEDANTLSSLSKAIKFINVECNNAEEEEIRDTLQQIKDTVEQQLSLNTSSGDVQSFVNPQSPNNLIYLPKVNGQDPLSVTDLHMAQSSDTDNDLLYYYQNKKLSVLGIPKEAMNFSSNEGLGGAGSVMSQRSSLYANSLQRLKTSYIAGWTDAINKYFTIRNMSSCVNRFELHMEPIITEQSTIMFDKRDAALTQAQTLVQVLKDMGVKTPGNYREALKEILSDVFPKTGNKVLSWDIDIENAEEGGDVDAF